MRVGFVTIGQSPRLDVLKDIEQLLRKNFEISECGALDDLSYQEILDLAPENKDDYILVSRLRDGREVMLSKGKIINRMQNCINKLEKNNEIIILLCTGEFPELKSNKLMIEPSVLLFNVVKSIAQPKNKLTVLIPSNTQISETREKWRYFENVDIYSISPYKSKREDYLNLCNKINRNTELVIMDCIGYPIEAQQLIKDEIKKPVILPRVLISDILNELII